VLNAPAATFTQAWVEDVPTFAHNVLGRIVVVTQASVLAVIGLVFGVPAGIALGRLIWRVVADRTPVAYQPPFAPVRCCSPARWPC
jgi:hypothetical protein